jgi:hypothetical protein
MNGDSKNNEKDASKGIDTMQYIVARLISEADDSLKDSREGPQNEFLFGRREAYYEILDIIKAELDSHGFDLTRFGLDIDLEDKYLGRVLI